MSRIWTFGADVDTDQIVPGRYAPYMRPGEDVGEAAFIEAHPEFNRNAQPGDIIVAGANFGCGSSREYAPEALVRRGIAAIIAPGFARIFFRNAVNLGLPVFTAPEIVAAAVDGISAHFDSSGPCLVMNDQIYDLPAMAPFMRAIVEAGGLVSYVRRFGGLPQT